MITTTGTATSATASTDLAEPDPTPDPTPALDVVRRARRGPRRRVGLVLAGLSGLLVTVFVARVLLGDYTVTPADAVRILGGADIPGATFILLESKLPRAVLGVLVGLALGVSGAVFQATFRNPLASPDIIGVGLGASAAAVVAMVLLGLEGPAVSALAVAGAVTAALVVRLVAGPAGGQRLVVVGIGVAAGLYSVIQYVFTRADVWDAHEVLRWLTGSVSSADWPTIRTLAVLLVVLLAATAYAAGSLRATELGADTAAGLGVSPRSSEWLLLLGVLLTAVAVAAAGPIAFVAFMSAPIARALNGGVTTLLGSALVGATVVVAADYVGDYLLVDLNVPAGVVTGAVGAPFLLWLLARGIGRRTS
jgi:iron complex transport system permease protein